MNVIRKRFEKENVNLTSLLSDAKPGEPDCETFIRVA
jgi:hypothetical protein